MPPTSANCSRRWLRKYTVAVDITDTRRLVFLRRSRPPWLWQPLKKGLLSSVERSLTKRCDVIRAMSSDQVLRVSELMKERLHQTGGWLISLGESGQSPPSLSSGPG